MADTAYQRWEKAETYFSKSIDIAIQQKAYPELARSYFDYAKMLLQRGELNDTQRANDFMNKALSLFSEYNMTPFKDQVNIYLSTSTRKTDTSLPEMLYLEHPPYRGMEELYQASKAVTRFLS